MPKGVHCICGGRDVDRVFDRFRDDNDHVAAGDGQRRHRQENRSGLCEMP